MHEHFTFDLAQHLVLSPMMLSEDITTLRVSSSWQTHEHHKVLQRRAFGVVWGHRRWWEHFHNLACHTGVSWSISPQRPCAALHVLQELSPPSFHQWSFASFLCHSAGHIPGKQRGRMHHKNVSKKFCNNGENVAKRDHIQRLNIKNDQKPQLLLTTSSRNWFRFVYCKSILKMILAILWNILFSYPLSGHFKSSLQSWGWKLSVIQSVELFCKILEAGMT